MHDTAMNHGRLFFQTYAAEAQDQTIVEIGAQDVNGSLRSVAPAGNEYIGVDFVAGKGVDVVLSDPYSLPFADASVDFLVSSSVLEHSEFFWLLYLEFLRILKPSGILYMNVPSNGNFHRYPVDCWRFYPDSGRALQNWGRRNGYDVAMLESFVGDREKDIWNDFIAVFVKDEKYVGRYPMRILDNLGHYSNGLKYPGTEFLNRSKKIQAESRKSSLKSRLKGLVR